MERLKMFLGSVALVALGFAVSLPVANVLKTRELNEKRMYYGRLELGIHEQCAYGNEEQFNRTAAVIAEVNRVIEEHRHLNRSGPLGDFITPDAWDTVGFISIPTEMECARIRRESRIRQCHLFVREGWEDIFHREECGKILASTR